MKMAGTTLCLALLALSSCFLAASGKVFFFEPFDEPFGTRWAQSEDPSYTGNWKYQKSEGSDDFGLFIPDKAKKYGIATALSEPVDLTKGPVVLQYDVRLQKGYDCGGAYIKFLMPQPEGWKVGDFKADTGYSVMFGPDKCGATNKVHFIFRSKSPKTGEFEEHHLDKAPAPKAEWVSHVYTAVINAANNSVKILIDDEEAAFGDLLSYQDFQPPVLLPKTIKDPEDKKPEDWDERAKIPDPKAKKPEDWDEDAPKEIPNMDAVKPEGWLDDEPLEVDDPEAARPEDWDEEEDGEWEPAKVMNPKCEEAPGCGEWKRPMASNPAYKGKWRAPMIENPAYKGIWSPRDIPNPDYFELEHPPLEPIAAAGIEIWTMTNEVIFDNILLTDSEEEAAEYRAKYWKPKFDLEKKLIKDKAEKEAEEKKKAKQPKLSFKDKVFGKLHELADLDFLKPYSAQLHDLIVQGEEHEIAVWVILIAVPILLGAILISPVFLITAFARRNGAPDAVPIEVAKKEDISTPDDAAAKAAGSTAEEVAETVTKKVNAAAGAVKEAVKESVEPVDEKVRRRTRRDT